MLGNISPALLIQFEIILHKLSGLSCGLRKQRLCSLTSLNKLLFPFQTFALHLIESTF